MPEWTFPLLPPKWMTSLRVQGWQRRIQQGGIKVPLMVRRRKTGLCLFQRETLEASETKSTAATFLENTQSHQATEVFRKIQWNKS